jgi:hypothetical protein
MNDREDRSERGKIQEGLERFSAGTAGLMVALSSATAGAPPRPDVTLSETQPSVSVASSDGAEAPIMPEEPVADAYIPPVVADDRSYAIAAEKPHADTPSRPKSTVVGGRSISLRGDSGHPPKRGYSSAKPGRGRA